MKQTFLFGKVCLVVMFLLTGLIFAGTVSGAEPVEVKADQVKAMMDDGRALVVFPLSRIEFNNLHIEGSVNIPLAQLAAELPADKSRPLVFYCLGYN